MDIKIDFKHLKTEIFKKEDELKTLNEKLLKNLIGKVFYIDEVEPKSSMTNDDKMLEEIISRTYLYVYTNAEDKVLVKSISVEHISEVNKVDDDNTKRVEHLTIINRIVNNLDINAGYYEDILRKSVYLEHVPVYIDFIIKNIDTFNTVARGNVVLSDDMTNEEKIRKINDAVVKDLKFSKYHIV